MTGVSLRVGLNTVYNCNDFSFVRTVFEVKFHSFRINTVNTKMFKISDSEIFFCKSPNSLEHGFLECTAGLKFFQEVLICMVQ